MHNNEILNIIVNQPKEWSRLRLNGNSSGAIRSLQWGQVCRKIWFDMNRLIDRFGTFINCQLVPLCGPWIFVTNSRSTKTNFILIEFLK